MKSFRLGTIAALSAAALATIGTPTIVHAESTVASTHASACKPYAPKGLADLVSTGSHFSASGAINNDLSLSRKVICPITRANTGAATSTTVYVDGEALFGTKIGCAVYSRNYDGTLRGQKSISGTGLFDVGVTFSTEEAPTYAYLSMVCSLPSQGRATLFGALAYTYYAN